MKIALAFLRSFGIFLLGIPVTLLGLPIVWIALKQREEYPDSCQAFTQYPGKWWPVHLPRWAWLWDNAADGMLGDTRGWWDNYCRVNYDKPCTAHYSMWQWAAIRNPANNWSRILTGVDQSRCKIEMLAGSVEDPDDDTPGWNLLLATRDDGKLFPLFQGFLIYPFFRSKAFYWRFGWKVELGETFSPDQKEVKRYKGSVFKFSPWKSV